MLTREQIEEIQGEAREKGITIKSLLKEKGIAEQNKLIHVEAHDRKVRKPIDTSRLEVKEEHLYPDLDNK